ncbi:hypothetical protein [Streptococcus sp. oral taxon 431]|uniref:hypothetical protein n=1 Tax=Streptococcus sp. oral taxon 431 TaxID=712633 RepID=UPI003562E4D6
MPRNFKEALLFTTLMCSMMVLGMSIWNLFIVGQLSLHHLTIGYIPGFITAFLLDVILVGPIARFILSSFQKPFAGEEEVEDFQDDDEIPTII